MDDQYGVGHYNVVNHGINGLKAEELRTNLQTLGWLNENPSIVLVMIGGNDLAAAETVPEFMQIAQETVDEVQDCVDLIKAHVNPDGYPPEIIVSAFSPNLLGVLANWGIEYYNTLLYNQLTDNDLFFFDNFDDLYNSTSGEAKTELTYDLVHSNDAGYAVVAENWYDTVLQVSIYDLTAISKFAGLTSVD